MFPLAILAVLAVAVTTVNAGLLQLWAIRIPPLTHLESNFHIQYSSEYSSLCFFSDQLPSMTNYDIYDNLDSVLKGRDFTLPTKVHLVNAMVFPVVMYGCELGL